MGLGARDPLVQHALRAPGHRPGIVGECRNGPDCGGAHQARLDLVSFQLTEIERVTPVANEDDELVVVQRVLASADRVKRGDMVTPSRLKNPKIPRAIDAIVLKAMAPDSQNRYQRAGDLLADLRATQMSGRRLSPPTPTPTTAAAGVQQDIQNRLKAREPPQARFCWHCRKPLHARSDRCRGT